MTETEIIETAKYENALLCEQCSELFNVHQPLVCIIIYLKQKQIKQTQKKKNEL